MSGSPGSFPLCCPSAEVLKFQSPFSSRASADPASQTLLPKAPAGSGLVLCSEGRGVLCNWYKSARSSFGSVQKVSPNFPESIPRSSASPWFYINPCCVGVFYQERLLRERTIHFRSKINI